MRYIIGMHKTLILMGRSSLIVFFALVSICCSSKSCIRKPHKGKVPPDRDPQTLLASKTLLEKSNTSQVPDKVKKKDIQALHLSDGLKPDSKKIKKLQRVVKVEAHKQAILLLHGLHRLSYDFITMEAALKEAFPEATILASTSLNKDSNKKGLLSFRSPSMVLVIDPEQSEKIYKEIKAKIGSGKHIVIVGHSQGGLRGFALVNNYRDRLKQEGIHIEHLITIGTPWKGAPIMTHMKDIRNFKKVFEKIKPTLNEVRDNYAHDVIKYFFKVMPGFAQAWPWFYQRTAPCLMNSICLGAAALHPESDFIRSYVLSGLQRVQLPITAIAGVLTSFSHLFDSFPASISSKKLHKLNATYARLIGGNAHCEHDMLLPVDTQHAVGWTSDPNFKRIKVYGACHGNKVGVKVKGNIPELNNPKVIQEVIKSIEATFYENKEELFIEKGEACSSAA